MSLNHRTLVRGLAWTTPVIIAAAPAPAFAASPPARISTTGWAITATSQETAGEPGQATNAFDSNTSTIWHSCYTCNPRGSAPQSITATSPTPFTINRLVYVPRQNSSNGRATAVTVEVLSNGVWIQVASVTGIPSSSAAPVTINFGATYTATAVRFTVVHSVHWQGADWGVAVAELQLWDA